VIISLFDYISLTLNSFLFLTFVFIFAFWPKGKSKGRKAEGEWVGWDLEIQKFLWTNSIVCNLNQIK
jgi:hypothetical protein